MSTSSNTSHNVPLSDADYFSLEVVVESARSSAKQVIRGLTTAPKHSPTVPCVITLPFCFHTFIVTVQEIATRRSVSSASIYRSEYGQLLDAAVTFANSTWTRAEKEKYEGCCCTEHDMKALEEFRDVNYKDVYGYCQSYGPFHQIVMDVFSIIDDTVEDIETSKSNAIKLMRNPKKRSKWPPSPSVFIPKSASSTVSAFITWARLIENPVPLHVLGRLTFCCPSLEQAMYENKELLPVTELIFSQFIQSIRNLDWEGTSSQRKEAIKKDIICLSNVLYGDWLTKLATIADSDTVIPAITSIYSSVCDILVILDKFGILEDAKPRFGVIGVMIYHDISHNALLFAPHDAIIPYIRFVQKGQLKPLLLPPYVLLLRNQAKCAHIPCIRTTESTKINFKLCAGCLAVRYCSRECQTGDWRVHKRACQPLKAILPLAQAYPISQLNPLTPTEELADQLTDKFKELGLTDEVISYVREYTFSHHMQSEAKEE